MSGRSRRIDYDEVVEDGVVNSIGNVNLVDSVIEAVNITGNVILLEPIGAEVEDNAVILVVSDESFISVVVNKVDTASVFVRDSPIVEAAGIFVTVSGLDVETAGVFVT